PLFACRASQSRSDLHMDATPDRLEKLRSTPRNAVSFGLNSSEPSASSASSWLSTKIVNARYAKQPGQSATNFRSKVPSSNAEYSAHLFASNAFLNEATAWPPAEGSARTASAKVSGLTSKDLIGPTPSPAAVR